MKLLESYKTAVAVMLMGLCYFPVKAEATIDRMVLLRPLSRQIPIPTLRGARSLDLFPYRYENDWFTIVYDINDQSLSGNAIIQALHDFNLAPLPIQWTGRLPLSNEDQDNIVASFLLHVGRKWSRHHRSRWILEQHLGTHAHWPIWWPMASEMGSQLDQLNFFFQFFLQASKAHPGGLAEKTAKEHLLRSLAETDRLLKEIAASDPEKLEKYSKEIVAQVIGNGPPEVQTTLLQGLTDMTSEVASKNLLSPDELHSRQIVDRYRRRMDFLRDGSNRIAASFFIFTITLMADIYLNGTAQEQVTPAAFGLTVAYNLALGPLDRGLSPIAKSFQWVANRVRVLRGRTLRSNPLLSSCESFLKKDQAH